VCEKERERKEKERERERESVFVRERAKERNGESQFIGMFSIVDVYSLVQKIRKETQKMNKKLVKKTFFL
jgi:hypothetical protein